MNRPGQQVGQRFGEVWVTEAVAGGEEAAGVGSLAAEEGFRQVAEGEAEGWGWDREEARAAELAA